MSRLRLLAPDDLNNDQREVYDCLAGGRRAEGPQHFRLVHVDGTLTGPFNVMLHAPAIGRPLSDLGEALRYDGELGDRAREIAILTVAAVCGAGYEWYAHEPVGRSVGLTDAELRRLRETAGGPGAGTTAGAPGMTTGPARASSPFTDPVEAAVHEIAYAVTAQQPVDEETYRRWVDALGETRLVEAVVLAGYYVLLGSALSVFAVGVPEGENPFAEAGGRR